MQSEPLASAIDSAVMAYLSSEIFPALRRRKRTRVWVHGPHAADDALALILSWYDTPLLDDDVELWVLATSRDEATLARAGQLGEAGLEPIPASERRFLQRVGPGSWELVRSLQPVLHTAAIDLQTEPWPRALDLILIRDSAFATNGDAARVRCAELATRSLESHSWLVLGAGEELAPSELGTSFSELRPGLPIYRRRH